MRVHHVVRGKSVRGNNFLAVKVKKPNVPGFGAVCKVIYR